MSAVVREAPPTDPSWVPAATGYEVAPDHLAATRGTRGLWPLCPSSPGLPQATGLAGGFRAWRAAGLPVAAPGRPSRPRLP
jgi:hypothetical protein